MKNTFICVMLAFSFVSTAAIATEPAGSALGQYELLTKLQGDWILSPANVQEGKTTEHKIVTPLMGTNNVAMSFKVIGKGSTVQENLLPGTGKEMATMYHCNKFKECTQVFATHYCAKQNQPELTAVSQIGDSTIVLSCDMKTALCNSSEGHVHKITHELSNNNNHLKTTYTIYKDGKFKKDSIYHFDRKKQQQASAKSSM